jgi:hypothetical protein
MRRQEIVFRLFLLCFCTIPFLFFTQKCYCQLDEMAAFKGSNTYPTRITKMELPQNLNPSTIEKIKEYVMKKSMLYKKHLHPAFTNLDTLNMSVEERTAIEENPYIILNPFLKGYKYVPIAWVENTYMQHSSNRYLRNLFVVRIFERFIRQADPDNGIDSDTILVNHGVKYNKYDDYGITPFFWNDGFFTVYFCVPTGDLKIVGGHAFLEDFPENSLIEDRFEENAKIIALSRLIHIPGFHPRSSPSVVSSSHRQDTAKQALYNKRMFVYLDLDYRFKTSAKSPNQLITVPIPKRGYALATTYNDCKTCPLLIEKVPDEPWDNIELVSYTNETLPDFLGKTVKGFSYYEIKHVIRNTPKNFSETQAIIRGVEQNEINTLKAKGYIID